VNKKEIIGECERLLIENNLPAKHISNVIDSHFKKKEWMIDILKLSEKDDFKVSVPIEVSFDTKPELRDFLAYIEVASKGRYKIDDISYMKEGKNRVKVSKAILDTWDNLINCCGLRLDKSPARGREEFIRMWRKSSDAKDIKHKFLCSFGDLNKNTRLTTISANPIDYFTSAGKPYCAYSTCIRMGGEQFNSVLDYLNSANVLVSYTTEAIDPGHKIGRQLVYLLPEMFAQTRVFGAFTQGDEVTIKNYIIGKIGGEWNHLGTPKDTFFKLNRCPYVDYTGNIYKKKESKDTLKFVIEAGICLECGNPIDKGFCMYGICGKCNKENWISCKSCGNRGAKSNSFVHNGRYYCPACKERFIECTHCSNPTPPEDVKIYDGKKVCTSCFTALTFKCDLCGGRYSSKVQRLVDRMYVCETCYKKNYMLCSDCKQETNRYSSFTCGKEVRCHDCYSKWEKKRKGKSG
jgi:hypothetical protein